MSARPAAKAVVSVANVVKVAVNVVSVVNAVRVMLQPAMSTPLQAK
jgi:hypothetical protein